MSKRMATIDTTQLGCVDYLPTYAAMQGFTNEKEGGPASPPRAPPWIF